MSNFIQDWWRKLLAKWFKKPDPPAPPLHPRNDAKQQCHWSDAAGAPGELVPGVSWGLRWEQDEKATRGAWFFYYKGGGDGLYKPHEWDVDGKVTGNNRLWLLPEKNPLNGMRFLATHLRYAYEAAPDAEGDVVRWCTWRGGKRVDGSHVTFNEAGIPTSSLTESPDFYHANKIKIRDAKVTLSGNILLAKDLFNQVVFRKKIFDRDCRQE